MNSREFQCAGPATLWLFARKLTSALLPPVLTALVGALVVAAMVCFAPGFGMDEEQMDPRLSRESLLALRQSHDAERNPVVFLAGWIGRACKGETMMSPSLHQPVASLLAGRAPVTLALMACGLLAAWCSAILFVLPAAVWRLHGIDTACNLISAVAACLPAAGMAIVLFRFGGSAAWMIAAILFPKLYQYLRGLVRQGFAMPHVLAARASGIREWRILLGYVVRPAVPQLLALAAISVNMGFGAAVAVEAICDLPGIGQLAWKAALARDLPVLVSLTIVVTLATQLANAASDLCTPAQWSRA